MCVEFGSHCAQMREPMCVEFGSYCAQMCEPMCVEFGSLCLAGLASWLAFLLTLLPMAFHSFLWLSSIWCYNILLHLFSIFLFVNTIAVNGIVHILLYNEFNFFKCKPGSAITKSYSSSVFRTFLFCFVLIFKKQKTSNHCACVCDMRPLGILLLTLPHFWEHGLNEHGPGLVVSKPQHLPFVDLSYMCVWPYLAFYVGARI